MSAIFGRFQFDESPVSRPTLLSMQKAMAYWGPDSNGIWCEGHVGIGHLQRNNTPESIGDVQPWVCPSTGDVITASVRLDNRGELLEALSVPHPDRASIPDSRVILAAYHLWGEACADRLLGDWVFAIWNARERKLLVARDHHGNTGLYYYTDARGIAFASSLKGLFALPEVPHRPNPQTIAEVLVAWPAHGAPTCYEGILRLPPAHAMTVTQKTVEVKRYWYLERTPDLLLSSDDDYLEAFLEVYGEAVRCRLRCSDPVGVTLSGGLDSGSVAALAAEELGKRNQRLAAFSSVPIANTEGLVGWHVGDETPFIEATAEFSGNIDLNYIDATEVSPVAGIERALSIHDQPTHGATSMYWITALMGEAQKQGLGAILTGQGGNTTISWAGGPRSPLLEYLVKGHWGAFAKKLRAWQQATNRSLWEAVRSQIIRPLLAPMWPRQERWNGTSDAWREYSAINPAFAAELDLTRQMAQSGHDPTFSQTRDPAQVRLAVIRPGRASGGHLWFELGGAYGLEVRDPTFDQRVMSFCWAIPQSQYVRDGQNRMLIRRAMAGYLPEQVLRNQRRGIQAADVAQRVVDHQSEVGTVLTRLEQSELARHYLDLPRMHDVFESVKCGIDRNNSVQCGVVLLRGLMVGLFLLRFD